MPDIILPQQRGKDSIAEMTPFITENTSGSTKPSEDIYVNEMHHCFSIVFLCGNCLHPLRHIVDSNKDIKFPKLRRKWSHEINAPYIKNYTY